MCVYSGKSPWENLCCRGVGSFYLVEGWIVSFQQLSILPSIALKSWNFPENLDFKGKIVAKFLLISHLLSILCNNMTTPKINYGAIKKYVTCRMAFSISLTCFTLGQFYSITSPVLFTKSNKLWNEKRQYFFYMAVSGSVIKRPTDSTTSTTSGQTDTTSGQTSTGSGQTSTSSGQTSTTSGRRVLRVTRQLIP